MIENEKREVLPDLPLDLDRCDQRLGAGWLPLEEPEAPEPEREVPDEPVVALGVEPEPLWVDWLPEFEPPEDVPVVVVLEPPLRIVVLAPVVVRWRLLTRMSVRVPVETATPGRRLRTIVVLLSGSLVT